MKHLIVIRQHMDLKKIVNLPRTPWHRINTTSFFNTQNHACYIKSGCKVRGGSDESRGN